MVQVGARPINPELKESRYLVQDERELGMGSYSCSFYKRIAQGVSENSCFRIGFHDKSRWSHNLIYYLFFKDDKTKTTTRVRLQNLNSPPPPAKLVA